MQEGMQRRRSGTRATMTAAYDQLRNALLTGELRPNARLVESELAERFGMSRTPVREVLQRLEAEGLVASERRAWTVREPTSQEIHDRYEIRAALEGYAAGLAARRLSDADRQQIQHALDAGQVYIETGDPDLLFDINERFHRAVVAAAKNEQLAELLDRNRNFFFNDRLARLLTEDEALRSTREHVGIAEAILAGEAEQAERLARRHVLGPMPVMLHRGGFASSGDDRGLVAG